jgi:hypothetical protein
MRAANQQSFVVGHTFLAPTGQRLPAPQEHSCRCSRQIRGGSCALLGFASLVSRS